jgi:putative spermidine/putrescine transport system permease protein
MPAMYISVMLILLVVALRYVNPTQPVARVKEDV